MESKGNVIDLSKRRRAQTKPTEVVRTGHQLDAPVVDMTGRRQEILMRERRQVRRTILTEFIGAFAVVPERGLLKIAIYDISEDGMAFDTDMSFGQFQVGEEVAMRVYMNQSTYFPFVVKVQNVREILDENSSRHGAHFLKGTINDQALHHFVKFIETVSASLERDNGDVMVSNLKD